MLFSEFYRALGGERPWMRMALPSIAEIMLPELAALHGPYQYHGLVGFLCLCGSWLSVGGGRLWREEMAGMWQNLVSHFKFEKRECLISTLKGFSIRHFECEKKQRNDCEKNEFQTRESYALSVISSFLPYGTHIIRRPPTHY